MEVLLDQLIARGVVVPAAAEWARRHQATHGGSLDTALLELDLLDEDTLIKALQARFGLPAVRPPVPVAPDPELSRRLPVDFSQSFMLCPLELRGHELHALIAGALPDDWLRELEELFGLQVRPLVTSAHGLALARSARYGLSLDERTHRLEDRLARRRAAPDARAVLESLDRATSLSEACDRVLDFAAVRWEFACLLVVRDGTVRVASSRGVSLPSGATIPLPESGSSFATALRHGGYVLKPVQGSDEDRRFLAQLGREVPNSLFIAPVPVAGTAGLAFFADNGERGTASRFVAELMLLVSRLGSRRTEGSVLGPARKAAPEPAAPATPTPTPPPTSRTEAERAVLVRLRDAADRAGMDLEQFVDRLLSGGERRGDVAVADEVKGLFDRLATDIPVQLAQGIEAAFREMLPRLSAVTPARAAASENPRPPAPAPVLAQPAGPREVPSYRAKRKTVPLPKL